VTDKEERMNIARGAHRGYREGACTMEHRYWMCRCPLCTEDKAKGTFTDRPRCSPATLGVAMRTVNDRLDDETRQTMACRIGLVPSILPSADPEVVARVERRVALWAARSVEGDDPASKACNDVTERYLAGKATEAELREAWAAWAVGSVAAWVAAWGAAWEAAWEARAVGAARAAEMAVKAVKAAVEAHEHDDLIDWLDRLVDQWHKAAADEGLMGDLAWLDYCAVGGS
jgi:hypothetical protein